mgnify:CR=1 FL=1
MKVKDPSKIIEEGASAFHAHHPELGGQNWKLNPYPWGSDEYELWRKGYKEEEKNSCEGAKV